MSLSGKTIVITRNDSQSKLFTKELENLGANVFSFPTIKITDPQNQDTICDTLKNISKFDWIIFTSTNAVKYFFKYVENDHKLLQKIQFACVGKKTAEVLASFSLSTSLIPEIQTAQGLLEKLKKNNIENKNILLPVSNIANKELEEGLLEHGAKVERIEIYKNVPTQNLQSDMLYQKIHNNEIDCITFYSPSALNAFAELMGEKTLSLINSLQIPIAVIGPTTAKAALLKNLKPAIQPENSENEKFLQALTQYFSKKKQ